MIKSRHNAGLTLIELVVAMSISIIVIDVVFTVFWRSYKINAQNYTITDMQIRTKNALELIKKDISKGSTVEAARDSFISSPDSLILSIPRLDANQSPIAGTYNYVIFQRDPADTTKLTRTEIIDANTTTRTIATDISNIDFIYKDNLDNILVNNWPQVAQVDVTLGLSITSGGNYAISYSTAGTLRNR